MFKVWFSLVLAIGLGTALAGWKVDGSDPDAGGGGGGGRDITQVVLTSLSEFTSTVTTDTFYIWNDASASENLEINLPEVDDDYTGLRITFMSKDMDHGNTLKVVPHAGDKIYDNYDEANNGFNGNTFGMRTFYAFFHLTFINAGNGEWITSQDTASGYWEGLSE